MQTEPISKITNEKKDKALPRFQETEQGSGGSGTVVLTTVVLTV